MLLKEIKEVFLRWRADLQPFLDTWRCLSSIRHIHGPKRIWYKKNEVVVICLVRNGSAYIKSFVEHYFSLNVKHIVFLDNNSDDNTVALAGQYNNITILSTNIPLGSDYNKDEIIFKRYLAQKFCRNRWCLSVDIDELFDYPSSNVFKFNALLAYLNANSYTAVISQMLDMFSDKPLNELNKIEDVPIKDGYKYYDISDVLKQGYFEETGELLKGNVLTNKNIKFYAGGIRKTIFGTYNWLTKHQLFFVNSVRITHPHCVSNARCADFTAVCLHYKFIYNYYDTILEYVKSGYGTQRDYIPIETKCRNNPQLSFKRETAQKFNSVNELIENGFLVVSQEYLDIARV